MLKLLFMQLQSKAIRAIKWTEWGTFSICFIKTQLIFSVDGKSILSSLSRLRRSVYKFTIIWPFLFSSSYSSCSLFYNISYLHLHQALQPFPVQISSSFFPENISSISLPGLFGAEEGFFLFHKKVLLQLTCWVQF